MALDIEQERAAQRFRAKANDILKDPEWLEEGVRYWLRDELQRKPDYVYSEREHDALRRIIAASTLFKEWGGYTVSELITATSKYSADYDEEGEEFVNHLTASRPTQLRLREMRSEENTTE